MSGEEASSNVIALHDCAISELQHHGNYAAMGTAAEQSSTVEYERCRIAAMAPWSYLRGKPW